MIDISQIRYDDPKVWQLFKDGRTLGVFQCESRLVQMWLRKLQPNNLYALSDIIAGVRPGALDSGEMENYLRNKNDPANATYPKHELVKSILEPTQYCLLYQEQLISLGNKLAWAHLPELERLVKSDELRKAVGKKDQAKILAISEEFKAGCLHNKVTEEVADRLLEIIKSSGRYSFNASHSMSYAQIAYQTAYLKVYYPLLFYVKYLNHADSKQDSDVEINDLVQEARNFGYTILPPDINAKNLGFEAVGKDSIRYGLRFIKFVASSLNEVVDKLPQFTSWQQVALLALPPDEVKEDPELIVVNDVDPIKIRSNALKALIITGAFDSVGIDRKNLYDIVLFLQCFSSKKECAFLRAEIPKLKNIKELPALIEKMADTVSQKRRVQPVKSEAQILATNLQKKTITSWVERSEKDYLYTIISGCSSEKFEKFSTHKISDLLALTETTQNIRTFCVIEGNLVQRVIKTGKNAGKNMATFNIYDSTGSLQDVLIFAKEYDESGYLLQEGTIVQLSLSFHPERRAFIVKGVSEVV